MDGGGAIFAAIVEDVALGQRQRHIGTFLEHDGGIRGQPVALTQRDERLFAEALAKNGLEPKMESYHEAEKADLPEWTSRAAS